MAKLTLPNKAPSGAEPPADIAAEIDMTAPPATVTAPAPAVAAPTYTGVRAAGDEQSLPLYEVGK